MTTGQRIGEYAKKQGMNLHQLAINSGVSYNTVYSIVKRKSDKVDSEIVSKIAAALSVSAYELSTGFTEEEMIKQLDVDWANYEAANKGRLFFNYIYQNKLVVDILNSAYIDLRMTKDGKVIARYCETEEKEIFLPDLENLIDQLSSGIIQIVKNTLGLPFDDESSPESSDK